MWSVLFAAFGRNPNKWHVILEHSVCFQATLYLEKHTTEHIQWIRHLLKFSRATHTRLGHGEWAPEESESQNKTLISIAKMTFPLIQHPQCPNTYLNSIVILLTLLIFSRIHRREKIRASFKEVKRAFGLWHKKHAVIVILLKEKTNENQDDVDS